MSSIPGREADVACEASSLIGPRPRPLPHVDTRNPSPPTPRQPSTYLGNGLIGTGNNTEQCKGDDDDQTYTPWPADDAPPSRVMMYRPPARPPACSVTDTLARLVQASQHNATAEHSPRSASAHSDSGPKGAGRISRLVALGGRVQEKAHSGYPETVG